MNRGYFSGRLVDDPQLKFVGTAERPVVNTSIAVDRRGRGAKTSDGKNRETDFWPATFWGATAEAVAKYTRKGDQIFVEGCVVIEKWETDSGEKRSRATIEVNSFDFGQKSQKNAGSAGGSEPKDMFGNQEDVPF